MRPFIIKEIVHYVNEIIDGEIVFEDIQLQPFNSIIIKNIAIIDNNPYTDKNNHKVDTLLKAELIKANFSLKGLFHNKGVYVSKLYIGNANLNLCIEKDSLGHTTNNIVRIFNIKSSNNKNNNKDIFEMTDIDIKNFRFRMKNYASPFKYATNTSINWSDLDVYNVNIQAKDLSFKEGYMSGSLEAASLKEKSGLNISNLSAQKVKVGHGKTDIKNIHLQDSSSNINANSILFSYKNSSEWSDFINKVLMNITLYPSTVSFNTISYFAPALKNKDIIANIEGQYLGTVNNFELNRIKIESPKLDMKAAINGRISSVSSVKNMYFNLKGSDAYFSSSWLNHFLHQWVNNLQLDFSQFARKDYINADFSLQGNLNQLIIKPEIRIDDGSATADVKISNIVDKTKDIGIDISLNTRYLNIGKLLSNNNLGRGTINSKIRIRKVNNKNTIYIDSLNIYSLKAAEYYYSNIFAKAIYRNNIINAYVNSKDPNLKLIFKGIISLPTKHTIGKAQFETLLDYANLSALNIDKNNQTSILSFNANSRIDITNDFTILGNMNIDKLYLQNDLGAESISAIDINSYSKDNKYYLKAKTEFAELSYSGDKFINDFYKDISNILIFKELSHLRKSNKWKWKNAEYNLDVNIKKSKKLLSFIKPGMYIADSSTLHINISKEAKLQAKFNSKRIAYKDKYIKNIKLDINNLSDSIQAILSAEECSINPFIIKNNKLSINYKNNKINTKFSFDNNDKYNANTANILLETDIIKSDTLELHSVLSSSQLNINSKHWRIKPNKIIWKKDKIRIDSLKLETDNQYISINGAYSKTKQEKLDINIKQLDLSMLNIFLPNKINLKSTLNAKANIISPSDKQFKLILDAVSHNTQLSGENMGDVYANSIWNEKEEQFNFYSYNVLKNKRNFDIKGTYKPKQERLEAKIKLRDAKLDYAQAFLSSIFDEIRAKASGDIDISLDEGKLDIKSNDIQIKEGKLIVGYTKVPYSMNGSININNKGLYFNNLAINDRFGESGNINGSINWNYFKDISLNIHCKLNNMEAINTNYINNPIVYGNVFGTGNVNIIGPLNNLLIDIDAKTDKAGQWHISTNNNNASKSSNLLVFKQLPNKNEFESYMSQSKEFKDKTKSQLSVKIKLDVNSQTEAIIELDKQNNNKLKAKGNGHIELDIRPSKDIFNINGNYNISQGKFLFNALKVFSKEFDIQDGSNIHFTGNLMKSLLDIKARYKTNSKIGPLIADTTSLVRRDVYCYINISSKLEDPKFSFGIDIPNLDPSTKALVESALNTEDKVQKQLFSLLIFNNFMPNGESGIINDNSSALIYNGLSDLASNQINSILQKFHIPIDIGLNYQKGANSKNIYTMSLNSSFLNDRITISGNVGNKRDRLFNSIDNSNKFKGDMDVEFRLDNNGRYRLKLFTHSADQYSDYLDDSQRFGTGIIMQFEFKNLRDLFNRIFRSKKTELFKRAKADYIIED